VDDAAEPGLLGARFAGVRRPCKQVVVHAGAFSGVSETARLPRE
jgi:hypothetical protein